MKLNLTRSILHLFIHMYTIINELFNSWKCEKVEENIRSSAHTGAAMLTLYYYALNSTRAEREKFERKTKNTDCEILISSSFSCFISSKTELLFFTINQIGAINFKHRVELLVCQSRTWESRKRGKKNLNNNERMNERKNC